VRSDWGVQILRPVAKAGIARLVINPIMNRGEWGNVATGSLGGSLQSTAPQTAAGAGSTVGGKVEQGACPVRTQDAGAGDDRLSEQGRRDKADGGRLDHVEHGSWLVVRGCPA